MEIVTSYLFIGIIISTIAMLISELGSEGLPLTAMQKAALALFVVFIWPVFVLLFIATIFEIIVDKDMRDNIWKK